MRKEIKSGLSTEVLLKGTGVIIDPLAQHVSEESVRLFMEVIETDK